MILHFSKMHGLGNDFVVIDAIRQQLQLDPNTLRLLADRHFGIGCDQILLVEPSQTPDVDFRYRIFNADGSEVAQCGNGARCFARFVRDQGLTDKDRILVETATDLLQLQLEADGQVTVNMGVPHFSPAEIPFIAEGMAPLYPIEVNETVLELGVVAIGNPHAVMQVNDIDTASVDSLGPDIESHPRFPQRVNAGFMQILDPGNIRLRVYERGTGETLACGSGACAAVVIGRQQGLLNAMVKVTLPGGDLKIRWEGPDHPVWMTGPATHVFEGNIEL